MILPQPHCYAQHPGQSVITENALSMVQADLLEMLQDELIATGYPALRHIGVSLEPETVILHGSVPTWHLKQLAQHVASRTLTGLRLANRILVHSQPSETFHSIPVTDERW